MNIYNITIDETRLTFTSKKYDITIIELKKNDKMNINGLEIDYENYQYHSLNYFKNKKIYILHFEKTNSVSYSIGYIKSISGERDQIKHTCSTQSGSSGSPIINLDNYKVLGVHYGSHQTLNFNLGTFIKVPIEKFYEIKIKEYYGKPKEFTFLKYIDFTNIDENDVTIINNDKSIIFRSMDQQIFVSLPCSSKYTIFADLENKLYDIYPEYKKLNCYFLQSGKTINRFQTIDENKIKTEIPIIVAIYEGFD